MRDPEVYLVRFRGYLTETKKPPLPLWVPDLGRREEWGTKRVGGGRDPGPVDPTQRGCSPPTLTSPF